MSNRNNLKQKAIRAALAVTMSASFVGGCADEDTSNDGDTGWNVDASDDTGDTEQGDTAGDVTDVADTEDVRDTQVADTRDAVEDTQDTSTSDTQDTIEMDAVEDARDTMDSSDTTVADADAGTECSSDLDDVCPEQCTMVDDADCCEQLGGWWDGGACAVPGPFVPPVMAA